MKPRILMSLPQMPQDPASGAARTAQTALEMAVEAGFEARALGTTATERAGHADPVQYLRGICPDLRTTAASAGHFREFHFTQRGVAYSLLDTGRFGVTKWEKTHGRQYDRLFDDALNEFAPDILFTYGGLAGDVRRMRRARSRHCRIAFCVFNLAYMNPAFFRETDAVLTPSEFLANHYRERAGVESTPLPTPLDLGDVLATGEREPIFVTMVNPSHEKGLFLFARLAEELGKREPEIAVLAIEARGSAGGLVRAGAMGGFDLRRHESIMIAPPVPSPRDIYQNARVLVAPSVVEEASGRVVAEALVNGVPPVVSDRGGLAESCNGAGFVVPLPSDYTMRTMRPVSAEAVEPWIEIIRKLCFDEPFYQDAVSKAREAGKMYLRQCLQPRYANFFKTLLR